MFSDFLARDEKIYLSRISGEAPSENYRLIDLFCGAGGMSLGFSKRFGHPFESVWANDNNHYCVETYKGYFGDHCVEGSITELLEDPTMEIPDADVVIGGPPCQGFSLLNQRRKGDPRNELWRPFLEVVSRSSADVFVIENVPYLLGTEEHAAIKQTARSMGFEVGDCKLLAADYGVPQTRVRAFIIGCRFADPKPLLPPRKTCFNPNNGGPPFTNMPNCREWATVREAIGDLPVPEGTEIRKKKPPLDLHFGRKPTSMSLERYKTISKEGMNRFDLQRLAPELTPQCWIRKKKGGTDLFGRLWWDKPAYTIRTEFFKPEKGRYLHPEQHRPITHREAARFQSFPDDFSFVGSKIEIAKQIGNAVPPLLAARIGDIIRALLSLRN